MICINQDDIDERTEQVKLMAEIYKSASLVVVWLGPEQTSDKGGIELLEQLYNAVWLPEFGEELAPDPRFFLRSRTTDFQTVTMTSRRMSCASSNGVGSRVYGSSKKS